MKNDLNIVFTKIYTTKVHVFEICRYFKCSMDKLHASLGFIFDML